MLIRFQIIKPKRAADRDRLERYQPISAHDRRPYLCGITGPEQPVLVGADCPENLNCQAGEASNENMMRTECVDEEIVLNFVYVPKVRLL